MAESTPPSTLMPLVILKKSQFDKLLGIVNEVDSLRKELATLKLKNHQTSHDKKDLPSGDGPQDLSGDGSAVLPSLTPEIVPTFQEPSRPKRVLDDPVGEMMEKMVPEIMPGSKVRNNNSEKKEKTSDKEIEQIAGKIAWFHFGESDESD